MDTAKDTEYIQRRWPEGAIVYHIYPRSFQDSNADGIGDLPGITSRLDYLEGLGVNALWLSPFYPSPMADFGYDVADYCAVDPIFGTMDDFDTLLLQAHSKGIKVMIDLVPNHSSDDHLWFRQSKQSRDNEYADWYIWRDPKGYDEKNQPIPPNNWLDELTGETVWEWNDARSQYYLHSFHARQPDLNWANPKVREAFRDIMRFWLDKGVDGFRVDAVYWMGKDPLLSDDDPNPEYNPDTDMKNDALLHNNNRGWPTVYAYLSEMADVLSEERYKDSLRFMVTEAYPETHNPLEAYLAFYVGVNPRVAAPFNFEGINLPWKAADWRRFLRSFHTALEQFSQDCVPSYAFGNHDRPRLVSRLGSTQAARSAAVMLMTLPGMVFVYYGEEIGMENVAIPPELVKDPMAKMDPKNPMGRDIARTPMQWDGSKNAGFSDAAATWLPLASDYAQHNVQIQEADDSSIYSLYRKLCGLRNASPALRHGSMEILKTDSPAVLAYRRKGADEDVAYVVLVNFSKEEVIVKVDGVDLKTANSVVTSSIETMSSGTTDTAPGEVRLRANEAVVYRT